MRVDITATANFQNEADDKGGKKNENKPLCQRVKILGTRKLLQRSDSLNKSASEIPLILSNQFYPLEKQI